MFEQDNAEESSQFQLYIKLTTHEINKLNRFAESTLDTEGATLVPHITDVLKSMIIEVHEHKLQSVLDILSTFIRQTMSETASQQFQLATFTVLIVSI